MKKQALLLAAILGSGAAQAQTAEPFYVAVAGGSSHAGLECAGSTSCDKTDTGFKLVGGYHFGNGLSLEVGYLDFGKFVWRAGTETDTTKSKAFLVGGAYALPFNTDWGMNVRLGLAQVKTSGEAIDGAFRFTASDSKAKPYAGLGLTYAVSKSVKVELGIDATQGEIEGTKGTLRLISVGASFAF